MQVVHTIRELREVLDGQRARGARIALVPTMGALHEGHLSLIRRARADCDVIVMSLFVNPTQFGDSADLAAYPRDDERDAALANDAGADIMFAPLVHEVYPHGFNTVVEIGGVTESLEGATRGVAHFRGVATVVAKLFNIVQPHMAYFGQKDVQQTRVIRQLVRDLNIPVEIVVSPTVRESDGLAMSSRNIRLAPDARRQAVGLHSALSAAQHAVEHGEHSAATVIAIGQQQLVAHGIRMDDVEYFAAVNPETLDPVSDIRGETLFVIAARVGGVRLIDNVIATAS